ncbi:MAG: fumarylacetoacetate hydrolase family protein [Pseudomonadales bacterium]|jgi:2-keto-4-pentenoate hydratase/2-oxohepta-3-ene-1,7-dioic acid hydratase in catechol pathway|nr:fumarylacetoacetate hydrolase family protein [Pseudomonadales bacterium]
MHPEIKRPPAILCIGRNYADHAAEMGGEAPDRPVVFMKNPASVIDHDEPIVIPHACIEHGPQVDYEGELAVVIGADARDVAPDRALDCVAGYACANDVSARWWQREGAGGQFVRGKSFDTFCPIGDLVPASDVPDVQQLRLVTRLNGEVVQEASTSLMLHPVATLIAELSRGMTILAGTVILTGTPAGVGAGRTPPRFLKDGDVVEVEIEHVGLLRNPVRDECAN